MAPKKKTKRKKGKAIRKTTKGKGANYRKTKSGAGMTRKGVKAYRRANPGSKLKTAAKIGLPIAGAALLVKGIDDVMNNSDADDSNTENEKPSGNTPPVVKDPNDGRTKGYGSRTRAYGWWKRSHSDSPYTSTDHFKNIRGK